jgi:imidazoleglycerol-phosphate dehydratase/histidinol-phosphatase
MKAPLQVLFLDRDGTLVEEPPDEQVDALEKIRFMPGVIPALLALRDAGFRFLMVTNQNGIGTPSFPEAAFRRAHEFILAVLRSQGIVFEGVLVCPHLPDAGCACRKPRTGLVSPWLARNAIDPARSFVIGDRETDLELARNLGLVGLRVRLAGTPAETWPAVAARLLVGARAACVTRTTRETAITVAVDLARETPVAVVSGLAFLDHMLEQVARHGGFALELECRGDLSVDEHHTVEDCALALGEALRKALGEKRGIGRYGFVLPMDEARAAVTLDLSGRPYFVWKGALARDRVGDLPTELVPHFFRSLAESLGCALHVDAQGENTHHVVEACFKGVGRALRQALRREGAELPSSKGSL